MACGRGCLGSRPRGGVFGGWSRIWEVFAGNRVSRARGSGSCGSWDSVTKVLGLVRALTHWEEAWTTPSRTVSPKDTILPYCCFGDDSTKGIFFE